jgi:hypothetical protein
MATHLYPPQRPLSVGETLDLSFRIYRATVFKCLALAAAAVLGSQLPNLYLLLTGHPLATPMLAAAKLPGYVVCYLAGVVLSMVLNAAIVLRQFRLSSTGEMGGELQGALRRVPALVLFSILFVLIMLACGIPVAGVLASSSLLLRAVLVLVCVAILACVIVRLSVGYVLVVVNNASGPDGLQRSWTLTQGSFWRMTAIYTVALLIFIVFEFLVITAAGFVFVLVATRADIAVVTASYVVVMVALGAFAVPFYMAVQLAVLGDLITRREGADLAQRIAAPA